LTKDGQETKGRDEIEKLPAPGGSFSRRTKSIPKIRSSIAIVAQMDELFVIDGQAREQGLTPKKYLESRQITEVGYNRALENDLERARRLDQTRKRNRRKDSERKKA